MSTFSETTRSPTPAPALGGDQTASVPLYLGGLAVLLSGMTAASSYVDQPGFSRFTILLTIIGVTVSYFLRRLGVPSRWIKIGALGLCLIFLYALLGGGPLNIVTPTEVRGTHETLLISAIALTATFCSFLLVTDDAVLFSCVWTIALIGLTGTVNINRDLLISFVIFLVSAVFLLVHQNYLQSRPRDRGALSESALVLLRTQVALGLVCALGALVLGFLVAVPIQMVGRGVSLRNIIQRLAVPVSTPPQRGLRASGLFFDDPREFAVGLGPVENDQTEVLTVTLVRGDRMPPYWRGRTYDAYNGAGWNNQQSPSIALNPEPGSARSGLSRFVLPEDDLPRTGAEEQVYRFDLKQRGITVYTAPEPREVRASVPVLRYRPDNSLSASSGQGGFGFGGFVDLAGYEETSDLVSPTPTELIGAGQQYPRAIREIYLAPPLQRIPDRVEQTADEITKGIRSPYLKAEAIRRYVSEHCFYTLQAQAVPPGQDAVDFFLNVSREGYCDLYATAVAVLCRSVGLPARVATGFIPGTPLPSDPRTLLLRNADRHAWAEVYFPSYGWIPFDATVGTEGTAPAPAEQPRARASRWRGLLARGPLPLVLAGLGLLALLYVLKAEVWDRWAPRRLGGRPHLPTGELHRVYLQATHRLTRQGVGRPATMTPGEYAAKVRAYLGDEVGNAFGALTTLAEQSLYGPGTAAPEKIAAAHAHADALRSALARRRKESRRGRKAAVLPG